jgi:hypothetical protein
MQQEDFIIEKIEEQYAEALPEGAEKRRWAWAWTPEKEARVVCLSVGAALSFLVFRYLQTSNTGICCGDFDGYYHIRWSRLLWENLKSGHLFPPQFNWLPLTTLDPKSYVDHHLLFHILNIPFTWFNDLTAGAKWSATLWATLAVFSCLWLIVRYKVPHPLIWLLALLASSAPFIYRLSMAKAPPLSIIFMVAGIYLLFEEKYKWLALLGFLYVWTYSLFPTLLAAALIWTLALAWGEERFEWRPLAFTSVGVLAGFVANPYFPKNFRLFFEHLLTKTGGFAVAVGTEWYAYDSWELTLNSFVALLAMFLGYVAFDWRERKQSMRPLFFLLFASLLMVATFRSRRFVEYWPPFAVLFAAFSLQPLLAGLGKTFGRLPDEVLDELQIFFDRPTVTVNSRRDDWLNEAELAAVGAACGMLSYFIIYTVKTGAGNGTMLAVVTVKTTLVLFLLAGAALGYALLRRWDGAGALLPFALTLFLCFNVSDMARSIADDPGRDYYKNGAEWMRQNIPAGERVFNTDWDDFPRLFFFDPNHNYVSGLDPTYLYSRDAELSKLYENITLGKENDPAPLIRDKFGARYVFTDNLKIHDNFLFQALNSGWYDAVYKDDDCTVLKMRDQQGDPPEELTAPDEN